MQYNLLKSKTFWTVVLMFVVGGTKAITSFIPDGVETIVMALLAGLAAVFHLDTAIKAGASN